MDLAQIEEIITYTCITGLVALMCWIVWDVGRKAGASKLGLIVMMTVLMAAPAVFLIKSLVVVLLNA